MQELHSMLVLVQELRSKLEQVLRNHSLELELHNRNLVCCEVYRKCPLAIRPLIRSSSVLVHSR